MTINSPHISTFDGLTACSESSSSTPSPKIIVEQSSHASSSPKSPSSPRLNGLARTTKLFASHGNVENGPFNEERSPVPHSPRPRKLLSNAATFLHGMSYTEASYTNVLTNFVNQSAPDMEHGVVVEVSDNGTGEESPDNGESNTEKMILLSSSSQTTFVGDESGKFLYHDETASFTVTSEEMMVQTSTASSYSTSSTTELSISDDCSSHGDREDLESHMSSSHMFSESDYHSISDHSVPKYSMIIGKSCLSKTKVASGIYETVNSLPYQITPDCGEDAFFSAITPKYACLGVADGVGGWNNMGVNPALFARELMELSRIESLSMNTPFPWTILENAYDQMKSDQNVTAGSSTACILTFDQSNGMMHSVNLGDSGYLVFRCELVPSGLSDDDDDDDSDLETARSRSSSATSPTSKKSRASQFASLLDKFRMKLPLYSSFMSSHHSSRMDIDSNNPRNNSRDDTAEATESEHEQEVALKPRLKLIHRSKDMQHYFNAPFQLAILPSTISNAQKRMFMCDNPADSWRSTDGPLRAGDIIVMGTDGAWDNLFVKEVSNLLNEELSDILLPLLLHSNFSELGNNTVQSPRSKNINKNNNEMGMDWFSDEARTYLTERVQQAADSIVREAAKMSTAHRQSPFGREAAKHGWIGYWGGKVDDITIVTGLVLSHHASSSTDHQQNRQTQQKSKQ